MNVLFVSLFPYMPEVIVLSVVGMFVMPALVRTFGKTNR